MNPARNTLFPCLLLLLLTATMLEEARARGATTHYRLRLVPPAAARGPAGLAGVSFEDLARQIGDELGVSIRSVISPGTAARLSERRRSARQQSALRSPAAGLSDPVDELLRWARFAVDEGAGDALLALPPVVRREDRAQAEIQIQVVEVVQHTVAFGLKRKRLPISRAHARSTSHQQRLEDVRRNQERQREPQENRT